MKLRIIFCHFRVDLVSNRCQLSDGVIVFDGDIFLWRYFCFWSKSAQQQHGSTRSYCGFHLRIIELKLNIISCLLDYIFELTKTTLFLKVTFIVIILNFPNVITFKQRIVYNIVK